jgi:hypothetical protein
MNAKELADKFAAKVALAAVEREKQKTVAADNKTKRSDDAEHCKRAMAENVLPFCRSSILIYRKANFQWPHRSTWKTTGP